MRAWEPLRVGSMSLGPSEPGPWSMGTWAHGNMEASEPLAWQSGSLGSSEPRTRERQSLEDGSIFYMYKFVSYTNFSYTNLYTNLVQIFLYKFYLIQICYQGKPTIWVCLPKFIKRVGLYVYGGKRRASVLQLLHCKTSCR